MPRYTVTYRKEFYAEFKEGEAKNREDAQEKFENGECIYIPLSLHPEFMVVTDENGNEVLD